MGPDQAGASLGGERRSRVRVVMGGGMLRDKNTEIRLFKTAVMAPAYVKSLPEMK